MTPLALCILASLLTAEADILTEEVSAELTKYAEAVHHPELCHLKLVCSLSRWNSSELTEVMSGLVTLARMFPNNQSLASLPLAIATGSAGGNCGRHAPDCYHTEEELLQSAQEMLEEQNEVSSEPLLRRKRQVGQYRQYRQVRQDRQVSQDRQVGQYRQETPYRHVSPNRRQGSSAGGLPGLIHEMGRLGRQSQGGMPPIFTPESANFRQVCQSCDRRRMACTVFSVGTFAGCSGMFLVAGPGGQLACNAVTMPGSIGCGVNSLHCYMSGCGLIHLPTLPA